MNRIKIAYFLIFASLILLVLNISELDIENLKENKYSGIASNILVIISMISTINNAKKNENEDK